MKRDGYIVLAVIALAFLTLQPLLADEPDAEGCKDHPLLSRMPHYYIQRCDQKEFDSHDFVDAAGNKVAVEGHIYEILYALQEGATEASRIQIIRNYQNAVTRIGGTLLSTDDDGNAYMKVAKQGKEFWVHVDAYISSAWRLIIVEKEAMSQEVAANATVFADDIHTTGHAAVYGIYFDTNKSEIKPESEKALAEIAKLLKKEPGLKLNVVGHTDNTGTMDANMKLSQARAEAVVQALVAKYGIAASRLKGYGVGPLAPVSSNQTEEGKAKNRRVELVEQ